jgi:hypothetical protein
MSRRVISIVLAVVGSVLALIGGVMLYAREEIFDPDVFADNSSETLRDEQVRDALSEPIVDRAIDRGPDVLINIRPALDAAVDGLLESAPFRSAFRKAARKLYEAAVIKDRDEVALTVRDTDVLVADSVEQVSPELAKQIPRDLGDRVVEITDNEIVLTVVRVSERVRFLGVVLPIAALLCLVGSVAMATGDRRRALLFASTCLVVAAALGFVAYLVARSLLLARFEDETVRLAVAAVWEAFFGGLRDWILHGGLLAILVAAAAAMAREMDATVPLRRAAAFVRRTPETTFGRAGRAIAIGAISLVFVLEPTLALQIVAVAIGAYGLFFAFCELLALIGPPVREPGQPRRRLPSARVAVGSAAILTVLVIGVIRLVHGNEEGTREIARPPGPVTNCNGFRELCEKALDQVAFPAAHNAMSAAELSGWYQPNQRYGIRRQLGDDVRAFLIDSHYGVKRKNGPVLTDLEREGTSKVLEGVRSQLGAQAALAFQSIQARYARRGGEGTSGGYFCHVVCELGSTSMATVLGWFRDFLQSHPDEVLILFIEDKVSPTDTAEVFEKSGILHYAYIHKPGKPFPTMRELIESDKRLFVMAEVDAGKGTVPWYHQGFELAMETPYTFDSPAELAAPRSCNPNRGGEGKPLFQLNHWVEKLPRSPDTAAQVNAFDFLKRRARECERIRNALPGLVAVDYYNEGDLVDVTKVLNGLPRAAEPRYRERD